MSHVRDACPARVPLRQRRSIRTHSPPKPLAPSLCRAANGSAPGLRVACARRTDLQRSTAYGDMNCQKLFGFCSSAFGCWSGLSALIAFGNSCWKDLPAYLIFEGTT